MLLDQPTIEVRFAPAKHIFQSVGNNLTSVGVTNFIRKMGQEYVPEDPIISLVDRTISQINKYWTRFKDNNGKTVIRVRME